MNTPSSSALDLASLDTLTGGALTAPTSGERAARLREWMATEPSADLLQQVFKEMSNRDKGAAKVLREKLDELKRSQGQDVLAAEWAERANSMLTASRLNIADAMAWQRDAAKAGAPLSREPLAGLKQQLNEKIKAVEDLQHQVMVQRETAVLLAQRAAIAIGVDTGLTHIAAAFNRPTIELYCDSPRWKTEGNWSPNIINLGDAGQPPARRAVQPAQDPQPGHA